MDRGFFLIKMAKNIKGNGKMTKEKAEVFITLKAAIATMVSGRMISGAAKVFILSIMAIVMMGYFWMASFMDRVRLPI